MLIDEEATRSGASTANQAATAAAMVGVPSEQTGVQEECYPLQRSFWMANVKVDQANLHHSTCSSSERY